MSGKRQPTAVVKAKGRKHLSKAEEQSRLESEVPNPTSDTAKIRAPDWLEEDLRPEFNDLRKQLVALGIFAKLDRDTLARYLMAQKMYCRATEYVQKAFKGGDAALADKWVGVQTRYFKQCRDCASDLGLNITSRCRLVIPAKPGGEEEDAFTALLRRRAESNG